MIFISHEWVQESEVSSGNEAKRTVDNKNNDAFKICVEGIEQLLLESCRKTPIEPAGDGRSLRHEFSSSKSIASNGSGGSPGKPPTHNSGGNASDSELDCYVWVDYASLMQLESIKELPFHLDAIMACCDVVFTPLLEKQIGNARKKSVVYGQKAQDNELEPTLTSQSSDSSQLLDKCLFSPLCDHHGWKRYLNRAWCRLELFLGAFLPVGLSDVSASSSMASRKAISRANKLKKFEPDCDMLRALSNSHRPHVLCHRREGGCKNGAIASILEVTDDASISEPEEDVVVFAGDAKVKLAEVSLIFLPKPSHLHLAYYKPLDGDLTRAEDTEVIESLSDRLCAIAGVTVKPISPCVTPPTSLKPSGAQEINLATAASPSNCVDNNALLFSNRDRYVGSTKNGFMHGKYGFMNYADGNKYTGVNNVRSGFGKLELVAACSPDAFAYSPVIGTYKGKPLSNEYKVNSLKPLM